MNFQLEYIFAAVVYTECCAGILVNLTILAAIFLKWKTLSSLQPYYKILGSLVMSRSLYFFCILFYQIIYVFYPWILLDLVMLITLKATFNLLHYTNLWFATALGVFYCVKITNYNWKFLIFLKTKLSTLVPWLLLASLIFSVSSGLPFVFCVFYFDKSNFINGAMENMTVYNDRLYLDLKKQLFITLLGSFPPFLIFFVTICLLLHSLWMHTRRMRSSGSGFQSPNLESHFSAVKSMSLFLVLQIMYFILMNAMSSGRMRHNKFLRSVTLIISSSPSFFHSLYIISTNSDLKKTFISMFHASTNGAHG